jgi:hypothetical protein
MYCISHGQSFLLERIYLHVLSTIGRNPKFTKSTVVPDPGSRDQDVVLASAGLLGKPKRGVEIWNGEGMGRG